MSTNRGSLDHLIDDVVIYLFDSLDNMDLFNMSQTSTRYRRLATGRAINRVKSVIGYYPSDMATCILRRSCNHVNIKAMPDSLSYPIASPTEKLTFEFLHYHILSNIDQYVDHVQVIQFALIYGLHSILCATFITKQNTEFMCNSFMILAAMKHNDLFKIMDMIHSGWVTTEKEYDFIFRCCCKGDYILNVGSYTLFYKNEPNINLCIYLMDNDKLSSFFMHCNRGMIESVKRRKEMGIEYKDKNSTK